MTSLLARRQALDSAAAIFRNYRDVDYFSVGDHWSGSLSLLRLRQSAPKKFERFWRELDGFSSKAKMKAVFRKTFPGFKGRLPFGRNTGHIGASDDAQIIDADLFEQLRKGFSSGPDFSWELHKPNVVFPECRKLPRIQKTAEQFWAVVIDYHE